MSIVMPWHQHAQQQIDDHKNCRIHIYNVIQMHLQKHKDHLQIFPHHLLVQMVIVSRIFFITLT